MIMGPGTDLIYLPATISRYDAPSFGTEYRRLPRFVCWKRAVLMFLALIPLGFVGVLYIVGGMSIMMNVCSSWMIER